MICQKCRRDFHEKEIEESHDVPCYLFDGFTRKERKNKADQFPRHWLCHDCHMKYDNGLKMTFKVVSIDFSDKFFGGLDEK